MFLYNLKIASRNILRHKTQCIVGVLGLAAGFTAYILISLFVQYEYSWDKHNDKYDQIYRVQRHFTDVKKSIEGNNVSPHTRGITSAALMEKFPEIEQVVLLRENREGGLGFIASTPENQFFDENGIISEQSILDVFTYNFIEGTQKRALTEPNTVVLSKKVADKLFPNSTALGKLVILEKKYSFKVTGVYDDLPLNSILRPTFILSLATIEVSEKVRENIWSGNFMTYVLLKKNVDYKEFNKKLKDLHKDIKGIENEEIRLCPLSKLYLNFNDSAPYIYILWLYRLIGILVLLLTAFNYINLFTALSASRAKEVAVRKVNGSSRIRLMNLFLSEAALLAAISVALAFIIIELALPFYNQLIGVNIEFSVLTNFDFTVQTIIIAMLVGLLSGAYPTFVMVSQKITLLLKGTAMKKNSEKFGFRKMLITFQFVISIFLIVVAVFVVIQIKYLLNKDYGLNKENLLICRFETKTAKGDFEQLRSRLLTHPEILNVSMSKKVPMYQHGGWELTWEGNEPTEKTHFRTNWVSKSFIETMGMKVIAGTDFTNQSISNADKICLINETAWKTMACENPIGKWIGRNNLRIVGVVSDCHINNVFNKIEPYIMILQSGELKDDWTYAFRIAPGRLNEARKILKNEMEQTFPNDAFEFHLFSDDIARQDVFRIFNSINNTLGFFTLISILLTSLGLFGLVSFAVQRQTKEISIRKINGAHSAQIFYRIYSEYFTLILIASIVACPLAYAVVDALPGTYKPALSIWVYFVAIGIVMSVSFFTMLYFTIKAAYSNPVESLRYE